MEYFEKVLGIERIDKKDIMELERKIDIKSAKDVEENIKIIRLEHFIRMEE